MNFQKIIKEKGLWEAIRLLENTPLSAYDIHDARKDFIMGIESELENYPFLTNRSDLNVDQWAKAWLGLSGESAYNYLIDKLFCGYTIEEVLKGESLFIIIEINNHFYKWGKSSYKLCDFNATFSTLNALEELKKAEYHKEYLLNLVADEEKEAFEKDFEHEASSCGRYHVHFVRDKLSALMAECSSCNLFNKSKVHSVGWHSKKTILSVLEKAGVALDD